MEARVYESFREIVYQTSGISLGPDKQELVAARVGKRLRVLGLQKPEEYLALVRRDPEEIVGLLDVISTNFTSFFRGQDHFDLLAQKFQEYLAAGQTRFRYWSAACSTGVEPYSMLMTLDSIKPLASLDFKVLATDISTRALGQAQSASYQKKVVDPVPAEWKKKYFDERPGEREPVWVVKPELRRHVVFRRLNLSQPPFPMSGPMDCVFCRNVMIYFDQPVRQRLISEIERLLRPEGILFVGHSETLTGIECEFRAVQAATYAKPQRTTR
ncbi:MAG: protein-glutamate O-methyltransferase CheR [Candidatus Eisenbacteria bacterium]|uniref:protein-glutamate O-methyltransferase n=1 Tax=Eiseniibacteriota bacterium TaxID=2212470 RepID=A0A956SHH1_UNCEI|nr:protein-glutamate O-methyltransferase CheR [Candidatus Eisenbacteria bacterium]